ncbi:keratin-associated protein 13-1-like [Perognathus longimembris pacificus]|uniref:keratin-associated protein 13-1-like n=1 Tax=Perognathus longimembris pacificus TaxID=214514 RepID=UPI0020189758|nr:keratin-associated protein 13-1-like [Perognathus longimembris pacificus]
MSHRCSGNFSSPSLRGCVRYGGICSNSVSRGRPVLSIQTNRCRTSHLMPSPGPRPGHHLKASALCRPTAPLGSGCRSCHFPGYAPTSSCSLGCGWRSGCSSSYGSMGCRPLRYGVGGFPFFACKSGFDHPTPVATRSFQASCYRQLCGSGSRRSAC